MTNSLWISPSGAFGRAGVTGFFRMACGSLGIIPVLLVALPLSATQQVRVPSGTMVPIKLHYDLTTENVVKGDRVDFDVAENVVVDGHVVIPRGAVAWGRIIRVKGAGKRKAKDASVTFQFETVRAVDNQELPLRATASKPKKAQSKENEIEESSPIAGLRERMIGAEKGRLYAAYTDESVTVNAPEGTPTTAVSNGSPAAASAPAPAAPSTPATSTPPPTVATPAAPLLEPEQASIDFETTPAGADILIDGSFVGNTPSTLRVNPGRHEIELRIAGYQSWKRTMVVDPGSHPSIRQTLEKQ